MVEIKEVAQICKGGAGWGEKTCFICGEHFKRTDDIALVIVYGTNWHIAKQYKRLNGNQVMHVHELQQICNISNSIEDVYKLLANAPKQANKKMTETEKQIAEQFITAAYECGFKDGKITKDGCSCKMNGSTDVIKYNVFSDRIRYRNKRKRQMFDGLFERQIVSNVYNKFHELLGDGKVDNYSVAETLSSINGSVNKTMKDMGF